MYLYLNENVAVSVDKFTKQTVVEVSETDENINEVLHDVLEIKAIELVRNLLKLKYNTDFGKIDEEIFCQIDSEIINFIYLFDFNKPESWYEHFEKYLETVFGY